MKQVLVQETKKRIPELVQKAIDILRNCTAPQIKGCYFDREGGMCARGAIFVGVGAYNNDGSPNIRNFAENYDIAEKITEELLDKDIHMVHMNDDWGMTFKGIANEIERVYTK